MAKLRLYVDRLSQPSRTVVIFCLASGIEAEERVVDLTKRGHREPEYLAINPLGLVPAIDDNGFHLFESHAILRYLTCAYPNVKDHWYPADLRKRAQIDCILDWHHANLRRGSVGLLQNSVLAPLMRRSPDPHAAAEAEALLKRSLKTIETTWLKDNSSFLTGSLKPSIADLSLACEVMQLQLCGKEKASELLDPHPKVKKWLDAVEKELSPCFTEVHEVLHEARIQLQKGSKE